MVNFLLSASAWAVPATTGIPSTEVEYHPVSETLTVHMVNAIPAYAERLSELRLSQTTVKAVSQQTVEVTVRFEDWETMDNGLLSANFALSTAELEAPPQQDGRRLWTVHAILDLEGVERVMQIGEFHPDGAWTETDQAERATALALYEHVPSDDAARDQRHRERRERARRLGLQNLDAPELILVDGAEDEPVDLWPISTVENFFVEDSP